MSLAEAMNTDTGTLLRRGVLALAAIGITGTTTELVFLRHWDGLTQLIVWPAVGLLAVALGALVWLPTPRVIGAVRVAAVAVAMVAVIGIGLHLAENMAAGPLDRAYASVWDTLSPVAQLWTAATGGVGPAPVLAPGALAEISLAILLATLRHPVMEADDAPAGR